MSSHDPAIAGPTPASRKTRERTIFRMKFPRRRPYRDDDIGATRARQPLRRLKAGAAALSQRLERNGIAARRSFGKRSTPPAEVVKSAVLEADFAEGSDIGEAHRLVQTDAGLVRRDNAGERNVKSLAGEDVEERRVQRPADASAMKMPRGIDRGFDGPSIRGLGAVQAAIGKPGHTLSVVKDEKRISLEGRCDAARHCIG